MSDPIPLVLDGQLPEGIQPVTIRVEPGLSTFVLLDKDGAKIADGQFAVAPNNAEAGLFGTPPAA